MKNPQISQSESALNRSTTGSKLELKRSLLFEHLKINFNRVEFPLYLERNGYKGKVRTLYMIG